MVTLLSSPRFLEHDAGHALETPDRLRRILATLAATGLADSVRWAAARPASRAELEAVHTPAHVRLVEAACARGLPLDADTPTCAGSHRAAVEAAGAAVEAARLALAGEPAFALVRPPGHHATPSRPMGFCLFNNVAVAAEWARREGGARRVAIFDFDVHHGNGTQDAFYERDDVLFVSTHEWPQYPGTGAATETGAGAGRGFTVNLPLPAGTGPAEYLRLLDERVVPALERFEPDLLLVSAGYDAHASDPLGGLALTEGCFGEVVRRLHARHPRLALVLEGGYHLEALARSCAASIAALAGRPPLFPFERPPRDGSAAGSGTAPERQAPGAPWRV